MIQLIIAVDALKTRVRQSVRQWVHQTIGSILGRFLGWAFSFREVQYAVLAVTQCGTPIGRELTGTMESIADKAADDAIDDLTMDAEDIHGLEKEIDIGIEEYFQRHPIDANEIDDLDEVVEAEVGKQIKAWLTEMSDTDMNQLKLLVAQRMSY